jgi:hypothetical protein
MQNPDLNEYKRGSVWGKPAKGKGGRKKRVSEG